MTKVPRNPRKTITELEHHRDQQRKLILSRAQQKRKWYDELSDEEREILPIRWR